MNIKKMTQVVLNILGKDKLSFTKEGSVELGDSEKEKLGELFGEDFVEKFSSALTENTEKSGVDLMDVIKTHNAKQLSDYAKTVEGKIEMLAGTVEKTNKRLEEMASEKEALQKENESLKGVVKKLADEPEADEPMAVTGEMKVRKTFKINKSHFHNKMAEEFLNGNASKVVTSEAMGFNFDTDRNDKADSINAGDLKSEFGTYLSQNEFEVFKKLTQEIESTKYMTTKMAISEWRAAKADIDSVVQQFVAKWTPLAEATFKPCVVKNYRHKINLSITPDDINDSWLSYLYDESVTPEQMPITRYIIEQLLIPKVDDDRELRLIGQGKFKQLDVSLITENDPGQPTGRSMDGFVTIIEKASLSGTSEMNFYTPVDDFNDAGVNAVTWFEDFAKWIKATNPLAAQKGGNIFCPPEWVEKYSFKYRDSFPLTKNQDGQKVKLDFTNFTLVGLPSMIGSNCAFYTTKENFIHLKYKNSGASKIYLQTQNYEVRVFAEYWEGVGFAVEEGVFAYAPAADSGSGSGA